jgi:hypothetical protein
MTPRLISVKRARTLLKISPETAYSWHKKKALSYIVVNHAAHYVVTELNAFLVRSALHFPSPPTVDDLLERSVILLRQDEVELRFPKGRSKLHLWKQRGDLAVIKFPGKKGGLRFCAASLEAYIRSPECELLALSQVSHILGGKGRKFPPAELQAVENPQDRLGSYITRESLRAYLGKGHRLPPWVDPEDWIEDRLASSESLVALSTQVIRQLGTSSLQGLTARLDELKAHYIFKREGNWRLVCPTWLAAQTEYAPQPLTKADLYKLFGVSDSGPARWLRNNLIKCPLPNHQHKGGSPWLYRSCWIKIVAETASPGLDVEEWYNRRMSNPVPSLSTSQAARQLRIPTTDLEERAREGQIKGVRIPTRNWRFEAAEIERAAQGA